LFSQYNIITTKEAIFYSLYHVGILHDINFIFPKEKMNETISFIKIEETCTKNENNEKKTDFLSMEEKIKASITEFSNYVLEKGKINLEREDPKFNKLKNKEPNKQFLKIMSKKIIEEEKEDSIIEEEPDLFKILDNSPSNTNNDLKLKVEEKLISTIEEELKNEIQNQIKKTLNRIYTPKVLKMHHETIKKKNTKKPVEKEKTPITSIYETESESEEEEEDMGMDVFRKETLLGLEDLREDFNSRVTWLKFKLRNLETELEETNNLIENLPKKEKKYPEISSKYYVHSRKQSKKITNNLITAETFPLQKRRRKINENPIFSYIFNEEIKKKSYQNENEILSSLKLYNEEYLSENKKKKKSNLKINIPSEEMYEDRKGRSGFDIDDIVIPWNEIRNNFTIEEIKVKEIQTPTWKDENEFYQTTAENNFENIETESEDESDEFFTNLHIKYEIEERKRYIVTDKKKKRNSEKLKDMKITDIFVSHETPSPSLLNRMDEEKENQIIDNNSNSTSEKTKTESQTLRSINVDKESYIPHMPLLTEDKRGNFEEIKKIYFENLKNETINFNNFNELEISKDTDNHIIFENEIQSNVIFNEKIYSPSPPKRKKRKIKVDDVAEKDLDYSFVDNVNSDDDFSFSPNKIKSKKKKKKDFKNIINNPKDYYNTRHLIGNDWEFISHVKNHPLRLRLRIKM
jgi:hypothetical protein